MKNHGQKADATIHPCHLATVNGVPKVGQKAADLEIHLCRLAMANVALKAGQKVVDPGIHLCHLAAANGPPKEDPKALGMAMASVAPKVAQKAANALNNANSFKSTSTTFTKNCATMPTPLANCTGT